MEAKTIKKDKLNLNVEKHKKNRIKTEKNKKPKNLDFKVRFNVLTFLTYACRNRHPNKTILATNRKRSRIPRNFQYETFERNNDRRN